MILIICSIVGNVVSLLLVFYTLSSEPDVLISFLKLDGLLSLPDIVVIWNNSLSPSYMRNYRQGSFDMLM